MIENSVWSPMLGIFLLLPPSPAHGRQIPAKKKGCLSARSNQRDTTAPFGVFLSGSEKAVAGTTQRCSLEVSSCAWPAFSNGLLLDR